MSASVVITVARQLGSGGSYIGQQVAQHLGFAYIDRQILHEAAKVLGVTEEELEGREQRIQSFWEELISVFTLGSPESRYVPPPRWVSDAELIECERRLISELAVKGPCVILGHGAFHLLRGRARLLNIFVHAPIELRVERLISIYQALGEDDALRMIKRSDLERRRYIRTFTGLDWFDARNYHLTIDTGVVDYATAVQMIVPLVGRVPVENDWPWASEPA